MHFHKSHRLNFNDCMRHNSKNCNTFTVYDTSIIFTKNLSYFSVVVGVAGCTHNDEYIFYKQNELHYAFNLLLSIPRNSCNYSCGILRLYVVRYMRHRRHENVYHINFLLCLYNKNQLLRILKLMLTVYVIYAKLRNVRFWYTRYAWWWNIETWYENQLKRVSKPSSSHVEF